jgi:hypothetical protein
MKAAGVCGRRGSRRFWGPSSGQPSRAAPRLITGVSLSVALAVAAAFAACASRTLDLASGNNIPGERTSTIRLETFAEWKVRNAADKRGTFSKLIAPYGHPVFISVTAPDGKKLRWLDIKNVVSIDLAPGTYKLLMKCDGSSLRKSTLFEFHVEAGREYIAFCDDYMEMDFTDHEKTGTMGQPVP